LTPTSLKPSCDPKIGRPGPKGPRVLRAGLVCAALFPVICANSLPSLAVPSATLAFDYSMIPLCERVIRDDRSAIGDLKRHPVVSKLSEGMRPDLAFTPEEFAEGAFAGTYDRRFSWKDLRERRSDAPAVHDFIRKDEKRLRTSLIEEASKFLQHHPSGAIQVHLICGSAWDAFVLIFDEKPEVFLDIALLANPDRLKMTAGLENILRHELWHVGLQKQQRRLKWPDFKNAANSTDLLAYEILNEGIGHYYSLGEKLRGSVISDELTPKFKAAFALMGERYLRLLSISDETERRALLWASHAGVPFWEKWGAIPGAWIAFQLNRRLGEAAMREIIARGPFEYLIRYDQLQKAEPSWPALPTALMSEVSKRKASD
jgi:hypothetical protein